MVVDSSALISILLMEAGASFFADALIEDPNPVVRAATYVEAGMVVWGREVAESLRPYHDLLDSTGCTVIQVDAKCAEVALDAFLRFGKRRYKAALNFGDCFSCALARLTGQPLLCKGDEFIQTDIPCICPRA